MESSRRLRRLASMVHRSWDALQVELHGKYSIQHLHKMWCYSRRTSIHRACTVLLITPIPSAAMITLLDLIPLRPPSPGSNNNVAFWIRSALGSFVMNFTILQEFDRLIPAIQTSLKELLIMTTIITVALTSGAVGMSQVIGFPLPFHYVVMSPIYTVLLLTVIGLAWSKYLRGDPAVRRDLANIQNVLNVMSTLMVVYPTFNYVFMILSPGQQTVVAALLPMLKLAVKNIISPFFNLFEDLKPQLIVLTVDVFHALFIAICMQNSPSVRTTVMLIAASIARTYMSLRDVNLVVKEISKLQRKMSRRSAKGAPPSKDAQRTPSPTHYSTLLEHVLFIAKHDAELTNCPDIRLATHRLSTRAPTIRKSIKSRIRPGPQTVALGRLPIAPQPSTVKARVVQSIPETAASTSFQTFDLSTIPDEIVSEYEQRQLMHTLTSKERAQYVTATLRFFYIVEFLLLSEFMEVVIPIIYSTYVLILSQLPNRVFYAQLKDLADETMMYKVGNVMCYAIFELVSFIVLHFILRTKLQISPFHQLAFVLETQWQHVQLKLIVWMFFMVQYTLEHFGADYTFKFAWLKKHDSS